MIAISLVFLTGGCDPGPNSLPSDRFDYSTSISESWKRQMLLNIVRLRYLDPPTFLEVGQIVAGYSLEQSANVGGQLSSTTAVTGNFLTLGASVRFTDRPTITYTPLTGGKFVKGLMTPLTPTSVFFIIQTGFAADGVLFATTSSLCGLKNQESSMGGVTPANPDFVRALNLLRKLQLSDEIGMRIEQEAHKSQTLVTFQTHGLSEQTAADSRELRQLLHLDPDASEFKLVYGSVANNTREIAVRTRSLLHVINTMAQQVEIPSQDIAEGRATPGICTNNSILPAQQRLVRILNSQEEPEEAYVAIRYRNRWFYIDDRDVLTKRAFSFLVLLFTLAETGEKDPLPLITIPAQ